MEFKPGLIEGTFTGSAYADNRRHMYIFEMAKDGRLIEIKPREEYAGRLFLGWYQWETTEPARCADCVWRGYAGAADRCNRGGGPHFDRRVDPDFRCLCFEGTLNTQKIEVADPAPVRLFCPN
jgi:hypothetical protein